MDGDGQQEVVIVESFGQAYPGERCAEAVVPTPLAGTNWRLTELPGEEGFVVDPDLGAHLVLDGEEGRVSGSSVTWINRKMSQGTPDRERRTR